MTHRLVPLSLALREKNDRTNWRCTSCGEVFVGLPEGEQACATLAAELVGAALLEQPAPRPNLARRSDS